MEKSLIHRCEALKILELRHKVGAHTVDFLDKGEVNPHQYQRGSLDNRVITTSDSKDNFTYYNLKDLVIEFNLITEELIILATEKFINTVLKNGGAKKDEYIERLQAVKWAKKGDHVIWIDHGKEKFVIRMVDASKNNSTKHPIE